LDANCPNNDPRDFASSGCVTFLNACDRSDVRFAHTDILSCARGVKRTLIGRFAAERTKARNRLGNGPRAVAAPLAVPALASGGAVVVGFQIINARTSFSLRTLPNFFSVLRSVGQNLFVYCVTFFVG
jgi:hypothetical protein